MSIEKSKMAEKLPKIELEMTLADMYREIGKEIFFVPTMLSSRFDLTPAVKRCNKYIYQHEAMNSPAGTGLEGVGGLAYVIKFLSMIPQQFAFAAGGMSVLMFDIETPSSELQGSLIEKSRCFAETTMSVLESHQRPKLRFYQGPADVALNAESQILAASWPVDGLEHLPHTLEPEIHYVLHSKEGLARSGLRTPAFEVITVTFPADGISATWLAAESQQIISKIEARPIPFALKLQQTMLGFGTYIIRTKSEQQNLTNNILPNLLANYLPYLNASNAHLYPANLIITEIVEDTAADLSLTFFINQAGHCTFICGTTQVLAEGVFFSGATINYRDQGKFEQRCSRTMEHIGQFLHSKGYYGTINADVLEDANGIQWIVDLNVRMPGSYVLGALKKHFWIQRGLMCASLLFKSLLRTPREVFIDLLWDDFMQGRIVIAAWYEDTKKTSFATLVVGAEDERGLVSTIERVSTLCEE